ncbi:MAG TPA: pectinesterase family protein, partial [Treponemataceae bacterium]|nr:pectinesterase family protein [Treponemataceae bacterium]
SSDCESDHSISQYPRQTSFWTFPDNAKIEAPIPLLGTEKRITLLLGARSSYQRGGYAPWPLFRCNWDDGVTSFILQHNKTNQIKAPIGQINLDTTAFSDIQIWRHYRIVFEKKNSACSKMITVSVSIDGNPIWQNTCEPVDESSGTPIFDLYHPTNETAHAAFSYILVVLDTNIETESLENLSALAGRDLTKFPSPDLSLIPFEPLPPVPLTETWLGDMNPFHVFSDGTRGLNPSSLSFSKNRVLLETVANEQGVLSEIGTCTWVDPEQVDGTGYFATIKAAINALPPEGGTVRLKKGIYTEPFHLENKMVHLIGDDPSTTIITGYRAYTNGIRGNTLIHITGGTFKAENITFYNRGAEWNTYIGHEEKRGAALCIEKAKDCFFRNCWFLGQQDTLYIKNGTAVFEDCYIEGTTDFICGGATALFLRCHLHALFAKEPFVTAAAPVNRCDFPLPRAARLLNIPELAGFIFNKCTVTMDCEQKRPIHLVRGPWVNGSDLGDVEKLVTPSAVAWLHCKFGTKERPVLLDRNALWSNMDRPCTAELYTESYSTFHSPNPS